MTIFLSSPILINRLLKQICAKTLQTFALAILWRVLDCHSFNDKNIAKMVNLVKDLQIEIYLYGEVVVAQLVEWSLPIPEVCGSNPVIGKNLFIY